jgi:hypothetical protein
MSRKIILTELKSYIATYFKSKSGKREKEAA